MLGLPSSEAFSSVYNITKENRQLEEFEPNGKKDNHWSLENIGKDDQTFRPEDLKNENSKTNCHW